MDQATDNQTRSKTFLGRRKWLGLGGLGLCGLAFSAWMLQVDFKAQSRDLQTPAFVPGPAQLLLEAESQATEGQPYSLRMRWRDLPAATELPPQSLTLRWRDQSYAGKPLNQSLTVRLGQLPIRPQLIFQSPGQHVLEVLGADGQIWHRQQIHTKPFLATVHPAQWEENRQLEQNPNHYHLWVNLHFDPKAPDAQRQHVTITQDGQILERLLISAGAQAHMTPSGEFSLGFKDYYPRSRRYNNTPMPFWSAINVKGNEGEWGFHSLEDGGYQYLLGRPASHGCIRLSRLPSVETDPKTGKAFWGDRGGARWIYDRLPKGAGVSIFAHKRPAFEFEDYSRFLTRQAKEFQAAKAKQSQAKALTAKPKTSG